MKIGGSTDGVGGLRPREPARGPDEAKGPSKSFDVGGADKAEEAASTQGRFLWSSC